MLTKKGFLFLKCLIATGTLGIALLSSSLTVATPTSENASTPYFKVAVTHSPPYAYKNGAGKWVGITVDLWEQISKNLGYRYDFVELSEKSILTALHQGSCDVSVAEMAPSVAAKHLIDFSEPYLASRLVIAFNNALLLQEIMDFFHSLMGNGFLHIFSIMIVALFFFSLILWILERRHQEGHFSGKPPHAIGSALWFGAVTMTSIGYGDKIPQTFLGRSATLIWMIAGMMLIAILTGTVVSSISTASTKKSVKHISDLTHYKNGVVADGYADKTLHFRGIHAQLFSSVDEGLKALSHRQITAFIDDSISLQYSVARHYPEEFRLSSLPSGTIYRSLGLRPHLAQREDINSALLEITSSPEWNTHIEQWTGPLLLGH